MKSPILLALSLSAASLLVGCSVDSSADDLEETAEGSDALKPLNAAYQCAYGATIDSMDGVAVKCNHTNHTGAYQCVELADRYMNVVKNKPTIHGNATDFCKNAPAGYHVFNPAGTWGHKSKDHKPSKGDLVVWGGGTGSYGHVGVVSSTDSTHIKYIQQNWGGSAGFIPDKEVTWSSSNDFFGSPGGSYAAKCWIHATKSGDGDDETRKSDCTTGGIYCGGNKLHGDADTLYKCNADGSAKKLESCDNGCINVSGGADVCRECVVGGLYCGGNGLDGDADTLYRCTDKATTKGEKVEKCSKVCIAKDEGADICE